MLNRDHVQVLDITTTTEQRDGPTEANDTCSSFERGLRFWLIIATLCLMSILGALENTVVTTSLPYITKKLDLGENYIWVVHVFFLTNAAVQPFFGQLADIFGRRWITIIIVSLFTLGSGICGGAKNGTMLIAGRAVQGMGSGGIGMIVEVIISDVVPLRQRGSYMSYILVVSFIGTVLGPWIGGTMVDHTSWRWIFYINLPIGGTCLLMIFLFLQVRYRNQVTLSEKIRRIDFIGNVILISATTSILYALSYGGARYKWSSWRIIVSLVLGFVGFIVFMVFECSPCGRDPVVPPRLFRSRTSKAIFAITFLTSALLFWVMFFLSVYYQAVLGSSPERSGLQLALIIVTGVPAALLAVSLLTRFGRYKALHILGIAVCMIGLGLFTLFDAETPTVEWVIFPMIVGAGAGLVFNTLLPACQAGIPESDQAAMTATWSFLRGFGSIWGVGISTAIFNNRFGNLLDRIPDVQVQQLLSGGHAYEYASADFLHSFKPELRQIIVSVYVDSLKQVWQIAIGFMGVGFLLAFLEKEIPLRTDLVTEYGLERTSQFSLDSTRKKHAN
ncbi:DNA repair protein RAD50 [Aspergillus insuetus]